MPTVCHLSGVLCADTPNYNITRGIALSNNCSCTGYGEACEVKPWKTMYDGTDVSAASGWTCFESFGDCGAHPIVRCTWKGAHYQPLHGQLGPNVTLKDKHNFFANVAWEFFHRFWIGEGTEKEASLLGGGSTHAMNYA